MAAPDPFDLDRFVSAQAPVYAAILTELQAGQKRSHWMWFIFPQMRGLGASPMATFFGMPDDAKFRSSMTLFANAVGGRDASFQAALDHFCEGLPDERTLKLLAA